MRAGGWLALGGTAWFVASTAALHVLQPELDPRTEAVSYYVHGRAGWLLTAGLIAWGAGSLALALGLRRGIEGRWAATSRWLLGVWGAGALLGGVFSADPRGSWSGPPSLAGMIHGNAALLAFLALPLAAISFAACARRDPSWPPSDLYVALALAAAASYVLFVASLAPVFVRPGPPILLGLTERVLLLVYAAWISAVGVGAIRHDGA